MCLPWNISVGFILTIYNSFWQIIWLGLAEIYNVVVENNFKSSIDLHYQLLYYPLMEQSVVFNSNKNKRL